MGKLSMKLIEDTKTRRQTFAKRNKGLKKKTHELSTLCDIEACMISFGMDGEVENWPEDKAEVCRTIKRYMAIPKEQREKHMILDIPSDGSVEDQNGSEDQEDDNDVVKNPVSNDYGDMKVFNGSLIDKISDNDDLAKLESLLLNERQKVQKTIDLIVESKNSSPCSCSTSGGATKDMQFSHQLEIQQHAGSSKQLQHPRWAIDLGYHTVVNPEVCRSAVEMPVEKQSYYLESTPIMPYTWLWN